MGYLVHWLRYTTCCDGNVFYPWILKGALVGGHCSNGDMAAGFSWFLVVSGATLRNCRGLWGACGGRQCLKVRRKLGKNSFRMWYPASINWLKASVIWYPICIVDWDSKWQLGLCGHWGDFQNEAGSFRDIWWGMSLHSEGRFKCLLGTYPRISLWSKFCSIWVPGCRQQVWVVAGSMESVEV